MLWDNINPHGFWPAPSLWKNTLTFAGHKATWLALLTVYLSTTRNVGACGTSDVVCYHRDVTQPFVLPLFPAFERHGTPPNPPTSPTPHLPLSTTAPSGEQMLEPLVLFCFCSLKVIRSDNGTTYCGWPFTSHYLQLNKVILFNIFRGR